MRLRNEDEAVMLTCPPPAYVYRSPPIYLGTYVEELSLHLLAYTYHIPTYLPT